MNVDDARNARELLRRCAAVYDDLVSRALTSASRGDDEATLKWIALAARGAWSAHPGRYADGRLENVALEIGRRLDSRGAAGVAPRATSPSSRRRVLHVATAVFDAGGHSRLITNWIKNDRDAIHSLILLGQQPHKIPRETPGAVNDSGGELIVLPEGLSLLDSARRLRDAAQSGVSCVVLHQHPDDPVPVVALATEECPPVAFMNHADHVFSLGASVSDLFIEHREFGAALSAQRRFARRSLPLPLPLDFAPPPMSRAQARARLGIPDGEVALLSIGAPYKFVPNEVHNFFRTLRQVLARNPAANLYLIGVSEENLAHFGETKHERMRLLGFITDPVVYELAADLYLEGFPYGSVTAMLETAARGVCPVLMYAPTAQSDNSGDAGLKGLVANAPDEAAYVEKVSTLISDRDARERLGRAVGERVASAHGGAVWRGRLAAIYRQLESSPHQPSPLPPSEYAEAESDLLLGYYNRRLMKPPLFQHFVNSSFDDLTFGVIASLCLASLRTGDTSLSFRQLRGWLGVLKSKALKKVGSAGGGAEGEFARARARS